MYFYAEGCFNIRIQDKSCINDNKNTISNCLKNMSSLTIYSSPLEFLNVEKTAWREEKHYISNMLEPKRILSAQNTRFCFLDDHDK